MIEASDKLNA
ncbi:hypothetical protein AYI68_g7465, partial [Smittium mucronatum]